MIRFYVILVIYTISVGCNRSGMHKMIRSTLGDAKKEHIFTSPPLPTTESEQLIDHENDEKSNSNNILEKFEINIEEYKKICRKKGEAFDDMDRPLDNAIVPFIKNNLDIFKGNAWNYRWKTLWAADIKILKNLKVKLFCCFKLIPFYEYYTYNIYCYVGCLVCPFSITLMALAFPLFKPIAFSKTGCENYENCENDINSSDKSIPYDNLESYIQCTEGYFEEFNCEHSCAIEADIYYILLCLYWFILLPIIFYKTSCCFCKNIFYNCFYPISKKSIKSWHCREFRELELLPHKQK